MDPDANLAQQLAVMARLDQIRARIGRRFDDAASARISYATCDELNADDRETIDELAGHLQDLVQGMHTWLSSGGALPRAWAMAAGRTGTTGSSAPRQTAE